MKQTLALLALLALLTGCQTYTFDKPQPRDSAAMPAFPDILQGSYAHRAGPELMEISDNAIIISSVTQQDSFTLKATERDTVFTISDTAVLKTYKGYYFISRFVKDRWMVFSIKPENNTIVLGKITDSSDIARLKQLAPYHCDSTGCVFRPSQKQFIKYIKGDGFRDRDTFDRVIVPNIL
ncbi:MAG: hypothetical protein JST76_11815 [Bacteroidetes bacterium]|nr:hypothetical protein [Bacteroidota bacterium]